MPLLSQLPHAGQRTASQSARAARHAAAAGMRHAGCGIRCGSPLGRRGNRAELGLGGRRYARRAATTPGGAQPDSALAASELRCCGDPVSARARELGSLELAGLRLAPGLGPRCFRWERWDAADRCGQAQAHGAVRAEGCAAIAAGACCEGRSSRPRPPRVRLARTYTPRTRVPRSSSQRETSPVTR